MKHFSEAPFKLDPSVLGIDLLESRVPKRFLHFQFKVLFDGRRWRLRQLQLDFFPSDKKCDFLGFTVPFLDLPCLEL